MKRFLLFAGQSYYPFGGATDLYDAFDTIEAAEAALEPLRPKGDGFQACDWAHVLDIETGKVAAAWTALHLTYRWEPADLDDLAFAHALQLVRQADGSSFASRDST